MKIIYVTLLLFCTFLVGCGSSPVKETGNDYFNYMNEENVHGSYETLTKLHYNGVINTSVYDDGVIKLIGREEALKNIPYPPLEDMVLPTALSVLGGMTLIEYLSSVIESGHSVNKEHLDSLSRHLDEAYESILTAGPNNVRKGYHIQCEHPNLYRFDGRVAPIEYVIDSDTGHLIPCGSRRSK